MIQKALTREIASYDISRTAITTSQAYRGSQVFNWATAILQNLLPTSVAVFITRTSARNGQTTSDPFYFPHLNMTYVQLMINGSNYPLQPYQPDFKKGHFTREYSALFDNMGFSSLKGKGSIDMTLEHFLKGSTVFVWDLNPDSCAGAHKNHSPKQGTIGLNINFADALTENYTVNLLSVYKDSILVDSQRIPRLASTSNNEVNKSLIFA